MGKQGFPVAVHDDQKLAGVPGHSLFRLKPFERDAEIGIDLGAGLARWNTGQEAELIGSLVVEDLVPGARCLG